MKIRMKLLGTFSESATAPTEQNFSGHDFLNSNIHPMRDEGSDELATIRNSDFIEYDSFYRRIGVL